LGVIWSSLTGN